MRPYRNRGQPNGRGGGRVHGQGCAGANHHAPRTPPQPNGKIIGRLVALTDANGDPYAVSDQGSESDLSALAPSTAPTSPGIESLKTVHRGYNKGTIEPGVTVYVVAGPEHEVNRGQEHMKWAFNPKLGEIKYDAAVREIIAVFTKSIGNDHLDPSLFAGLPGPTLKDLVYHLRDTPAINTLANYAGTNADNIKGLLRIYDTTFFPDRCEKVHQCKVEAAIATVEYWQHFKKDEHQLIKEILLWELQVSSFDQVPHADLSKQLNDVVKRINMKRPHYRAFVKCVKNYNDDKREKRHRLGEQKGTFVTMQTHKSQIGNLRWRNNCLEHRLGNQVRITNDLAQQVGDLEHHKGVLEQQVGGLQQRNGVLEQQVGALQQRNGVLEQKTVDLKTEVRELKTEVRKLKEGNGVLEQQVGGLQQRNGVLEQQVGALQQRNGVLEQQVGGLQERNGVLEQQVGALQQRNGVLEQQVGALQQRNGVLEQQVGGLQERNGVLEQQVGALQQRNGVLEHQTVDLKNEVRELKEGNATLIAQNATIIAENATLRTDVSQLQASVKETDKKLSELIALMTSGSCVTTGGPLHD